MTVLTPVGPVLGSLGGTASALLGIGLSGNDGAPHHHLRAEELEHVLVTHAGLTRGRWLAMGSPSRPDAAAREINAVMSRPVPDALRAGRLVGAQDELADVTWAEVNKELYEPWIAHRDAPFSQVHGQASPFDWSARDWWPDASPRVREATRVDRPARRTTTALAKSRVAVSTDWRLGAEPPRGFWPLLRLALLPPGR